MFVTDQQSAELSQPSVGAFDLPAPFVASQTPAIFLSPLDVVLLVGRDQLEATPFHRSRSGSESQPRSVITRLGFYRAGLWAWERGLPGAWRPQA